MMGIQFKPDLINMHIVLVLPMYLKALRSMTFQISKFRTLLRQIIN